MDGAEEHRAEEHREEEHRQEEEHSTSRVGLASPKEPAWEELQEEGPAFMGAEREQCPAAYVSDRTMSKGLFSLDNGPKRLPKTQV